MKQISEKKKYKIRHDWFGKVIHWELYQKFKFDNTVHAQSKIHPGKWDAQTSQGFRVISTRWPDLVMVYKKMNK